MWVCLNDAFLSIVKKDCKPGELLVRARRKGDIERVFGKRVRVTEYDKSDYRFRAVVPKGDVVAAMTREVGKINYGNFKKSVRDKQLHDAYMRVWGAMADVQDPPPYAGLRSAAPGA